MRSRRGLRLRRPLCSTQTSQRVRASRWSRMRGPMRRTPTCPRLPTTGPGRWTRIRRSRRLLVFRLPRCCSRPLIPVGPAGVGGSPPRPPLLRRRRPPLVTRAVHVTGRMMRVGSAPVPEPMPVTGKRTTRARMSPPRRPPPEPAGARGGAVVVGLLLIRGRPARGAGTLRTTSPVMTPKRPRTPPPTPGPSPPMMLKRAALAASVAVVGAVGARARVAMTVVMTRLAVTSRTAPRTPGRTRATRRHQCGSPPPTVERRRVRGPRPDRAGGGVGPVPARTVVTRVMR